MCKIWSVEGGGTWRLDFFLLLVSSILLFIQSRDHPIFILGTVYIYISLFARSFLLSYLTTFSHFFPKLLAAPLMKSKNNIPRNMAAGSSENFGTFVLQLLFLVCLSH
jgi:hypothetical protein